MSAPVPCAGQTFSYVGSSSWIATTSETPVFDPQMRTVTWAHIVPGLYAPNGTMQSAGGSYAWLKNQVCRYEAAEAERMGVSPYDLINREIEQSPIGSNGIIFLPYLLGERAPRWNPDAKGAFIGLKMENERRDLLRSVLEGVTMNLGIILDVLRAQMPIDRELLVIGGGAKGKVWRQMMADVYDARIKSPVLLEEATSMGRGCDRRRWRRPVQGFRRHRALHPDRFCAGAGPQGRGRLWPRQGDVRLVL